VGVSYYFSMINNFNNTGIDQPTRESSGPDFGGTLGTNFISILKPKITVQIFKDLSIGFEHYLYYQVHTQDSYPTFTSNRTEDKIFLVLYLEDKQRRGHYN